MKKKQKKVQVNLLTSEFLMKMCAEGEIMALSGITYMFLVGMITKNTTGAKDFLEQFNKSAYPLLQEIEQDLIHHEIDGDEDEELKKGGLECGLATSLIFKRYLQSLDDDENE